MQGTYKKHKEPIHFVGIGGIGMSGIAEILLRLGYPVSGSDTQESTIVTKLKELGARIHLGHSATNLGDAKVVVYSSAVTSENPEVQEAKRRGLPLVPRAEMLAELMRLKHGIAIAGTHGKTSTTSLVAAILDAAKLDPTVIVGGRVKSLGGNAKLGTGDFLVAEADESDGSFLKLSPVITAVTNIDNDHLDHYGSMEHLRQSFVDYINKIPYYGRAVLCSDNAELCRILPLIQKPYWTYGFNEQPQNAHGPVHLQIKNYKSTTAGSEFDVFKNAEKRTELITHIKLRFPGQHYALNATAALAIALEIDIHPTIITQALWEFSGVGRRFEYKGEIKNPAVQIVDDYGHHPTEIHATLEAAKAYHPNGRLVVAFQPHRYSRTQICWGQFAKSLAQADLVLLLDVYPAGEKPIPGIDSLTLAQHLKTQGINVEATGDLASTAKRAATLLIKDDLLITLGAGSITQLGPLLLGNTSSP